MLVTCFPPFPFFGLDLPVFRLVWALQGGGRKVSYRCAGGDLLVAEVQIIHDLFLAWPIPLRPSLSPARPDLSTWGVGGELFEL